VKTTDLENHLIKKLINSENEDNFQNGNYNSKKEWGDS
jgi:hypothetical protein